MARPLLSSGAPSCLNCLRRTFIDDVSISTFHNPTRMQWRGKKKLPRSTTIPIRLLKDTPRYGPKGLLVSVPPATMRNQFFPNGRAAYLTMAERKTLADQIGDRDRTFGIKQVEKVDTTTLSPGAAAAFRAANFSLSSKRIVELLNKFVPPVLEFYRPILQTPPVTEEGKADRNAVSGGLPTTAVLTPVTNKDVASEIMTRLADGAGVQGESQASQVVVEPRDVLITSGRKVEGSEGAGAEEVAEHADRANTLGLFQIVIQVKGGKELKRTMRINPDVAAAEILDNPAMDATATIGATA